MMSENTSCVFHTNRLWTAPFYNPPPKAQINIKIYLKGRGWQDFTHNVSLSGTHLALDLSCRIC